MANNAGDQHFSYDDLDRLTLANGPYGDNSTNASFSYAYDEIGNLTFNPQLGAYSYPASGPGSVQPHGMTSAGSYSFLYDSNGNVMAVFDASGMHFYASNYDFENRLTSLYYAAGTPKNTTFVYDGDGRRVKKIADTVTTRYISKGYECDNTSCSRFIWAGGTLIATVATNGAVNYWHGDHLGSSSVITDSAGSQVQAISYYPYGSLRTNQSFTTPSIDVPYKYTGKELDNSTALYYYGARYYHPLFARFISADTLTPSIGDPQSLNRYTYVNNNPIRLVDPTGQAPTIPDALIGFGIGFVAGTVGNQNKTSTEQFIGGAVGGVVGLGVGLVSPSLSRVVAGEASVWAVNGWNAVGSYLQQVGQNAAKAWMGGQSLDSYWAATSVNWYQVGGAGLLASPFSIIGGGYLNPALSAVASRYVGGLSEVVFSGTTQGLGDLGLSMTGGLFNRSDIPAPQLFSNPIFNLQYGQQAYSPWMTTGYGGEALRLNLPGGFSVDQVTGPSQFSGNYTNNNTYNNPLPEPLPDTGGNSGPTVNRLPEWCLMTDNPCE